MIFFRPPFSKNSFTVNQNSDSSAVSFISFDGYKNFDFKGEISIVSDKDIAENPIFTDRIEAENLMNLHEDNEKDYYKKIEKVIGFVKDNNLSKLVISRRKVVNYDNVNLSQSFLNLCENYPNAFAYLFYENGICWMGGFSELLGKFNKKTGEFETMSLAGTLPISDEWTEKEINEQKPVTEFIKNILHQYSEEVEVSETYDHISGNIKHLRNDFKAKILSEHLEMLISELHPTPAVCGIPKDFCKKAIEDFEQYPRELYAGYIRVETEDTIEFFVNLRCSQFFRNGAFLYVGGGITSKSNPEKEWRETELKSEAIYKNLIFES